MSNGHDEINEEPDFTFTLIVWKDDTLTGKVWPPGTEKIMRNSNYGQ